MAKLVFGTNKQTVVPAVVRDMSPTYYIEKTVDASNKLISGTSVINLNGVTDLGNYVLAYAYNNATLHTNTNIDLSSLTTISGNYACQNMFQYCMNIISADLSSLTRISGNNACQYMFSNCSRLASINLSSLATISGSSGCQSMFSNCGNLTSVNLSKLTTISGYNACSGTFAECGNITSVDLSSLTTISGGTACQVMFSSCAKLTSIDLPSLTTISGGQACANMFSSCSGLTTAKLNALNTMSVQLSYANSPVFKDCTKLESVELGGLKSTTFASIKNQIQYLFNAQTGRNSSSGCTVHFPSNFDPSNPDHTFDASTLTGYPTFGGNASYIHLAFDLPATE